MESFLLAVLSALFATLVLIFTEIGLQGADSTVATAVMNGLLATQRGLFATD